MNENKIEELKTLRNTLALISLKKLERENECKNQTPNHIFGPYYINSEKGLIEKKCQYCGHIEVPEQKMRAYK